MEKSYRVEAGRCHTSKFCGTLPPERGALWDFAGLSSTKIFVVQAKQLLKQLTPSHKSNFTTQGREGATLSETVALSRLSAA